MSEKPYINLYTSDFLGGTGGMTAATKGVYITLLCMMYEAETPLTQAWDTLARRCGCTLPGFKKAIESMIDDGKIIASDNGLWSDKCDKHIMLRRERSKSARSAAKKRWEKTEEKQGEADANASPAQCQPEPEPYIEEEAKASLSSEDDLSAKPLDEIAEAVSQYNSTAEASGWPRISVLSKARRSALAARMREAGGLDGWSMALAKAQASNHCCGQNDRGWVANFDFLIRQSSFTKLMEGNYDNRADPSANTPSGPQNRSDPALEQIARLAGLE